MATYSTPEGVGPKEEYWDKYEIEFIGSTAISVEEESIEETKKRIAKKKNTNLNSVAIDSFRPTEMDPREGLVVRGSYYNFTRHNADLNED